MKTRIIEFTIINAYVQKKNTRIGEETEKQNHNFFEAR